MSYPRSGKIPPPGQASEDSNPMSDVPETMRAVLLTGHGGPEMLRYREDVPTPVPAPGEVLVRVNACGINNTDIWVREGAYGSDDDPGAVSSWRRDRPLVFPVIQGADIAGRVAAVGDGIDGGIVGKRVMVDFGIYNDSGTQPRQRRLHRSRPQRWVRRVLRGAGGERAHRRDPAIRCGACHLLLRLGHGGGDARARSGHRRRNRARHGRLGGRRHGAHSARAGTGRGPGCRRERPLG